MKMDKAPTFQRNKEPRALLNPLLLSSNKHLVQLKVCRKRQFMRILKYPTPLKFMSNNRESTPCADDELSDEVSSNSSITRSSARSTLCGERKVASLQSDYFVFFSSMTGRQYAIFAMIMWSSLSSSFTVCLFPPFFPRC